MKSIATWIRFILTGAVLAICVWWLLEVSNDISAAPSLDASGNIIVDQYQRSKDVLSLVLPFLTLALGYWFGSAGREQAQDDAKVANQRLNATLQVSSDGDLLKRAMTQYPEAFK